MRNTGIIRDVRALVLICIALTWSVDALAGPRGPIEGEPNKSYGAIDVILYQTSWCPYCNKARAFLKDIGVSLVEYDIERDAQKREEMMAKSGSRGVPVVDIEGIVIRGYSPDGMKDAIERKRRE
jgi:mycoredoxin